MPIIFDNITFTGGILLSGASGAPGPTPPSDQFFQYTTLLLDGLGTNGAQNNTFLDSSSNNFTITRNGNTTQGSFTPFSHSNGYWSNYFDGSGDYLSIPTSSANLSQTGDWTYEGWAYWNVVPTAGFQNIFGQGAAGQSSYGLTIFGGKFTVNQANGGNRITGTTTVVTGTWYHFALVRSSNVIRLYVNGNLEGTPYTDSGSYGFNGNPFTIGNNSNGYISNFRFNRTAVYTSNFTPSTTPLTAITGTQLLTCQNNNFKDNSSNNFVVTSVGNSAVTLFQPFTLSTEYNSSTMGGSMYFDGTGDYLTAPYNSSYNIALNTAFTFECWVYTSSTNLFVVANRNWSYGASGPTWSFFLDSGVTPGWGIAGTGQSTYSMITSSISGVLNQWNHYVWTRDSSNVCSIYVNGVLGATRTDGQAMTSPSGAVFVGVSSNLASPYATGYMSGLRFVLGTAVYTSAFTPPTSPVTAISGTSLLLNGTNAGIVDSTGFNDLETVGNAQISTAQSKWGGSSLYFDGSGDYLSLSSNAVFDQNVSFTVEAWVYPTSLSTGYIYAQLLNGYLGLAFTSAGKFQVDKSFVGAQINSTSTYTINSWYHVAMSFDGTTTRLFVNGTLQGSSSGGGVASGATLTIGSYLTGGGVPYTGYMQGLRVTKGIARYIGNFTPPTNY